MTKYDIWHSSFFPVDPLYNELCWDGTMCGHCSRVTALMSSHTHSQLDTAPGSGLLVIRCGTEVEIILVLKIFWFDLKNRYNVIHLPSTDNNAIFAL